MEYKEAIGQFKSLTKEQKLKFAIYIYYSLENYNQKELFEKGLKQAKQKSLLS